jgi:hypothetical protein
LERKADVAAPIPPNVETIRKPSEEQLAHVPETMLRVDPENNETKPSFFKSFECFNTKTFKLMTVPIRTAIVDERIKSTLASSGR